jgi:O-6-methylguanine DNA methyltransferase
MLTTKSVFFKMAVTEYQEVVEHHPFTPHYPDPPFSSETNTSQRVYALLCQIPKGRVSSYACLSKALSSSPRAVGGALRRNPFAPEVPCHRIINADGVSMLQTSGKIWGLFKADEML